MKVLIVDDDQDILNMITAFLGHYKDINIISSKNGEEAYRIIIKESPDLAIIDGLIPGMHGFELCKKVKEDKELQKPPKIIIMSGIYKGLGYKLDVIKEYHADDYLEKPIKKEKLIAKIEALIGPLEMQADRAAGIDEIPEEAGGEIPEDKTGIKTDPVIKKKIEDMYGKCEHLGHYDVLGVKNNASPVEIKAAYREAAKKYHPDMFFQLEDASLRDKLNDISSCLSEAYTILTNPGTRREYDKMLARKPAIPTADRDKARSAFEEGKSYLKKKDYQDAERLFQAAIYYNGEISEYHYYYGLTLAMQKKFREGQKALERARSLDPQNAIYLTELGLVYLELGYPLRAKGFFEKALSSSPDNAGATEGLKKIKDAEKRGTRK
jgi:curved DNA-binding protein CbpA/DNA-binding NarL/FixJ family response regulator